MQSMSSVYRKTKRFLMMQQYFSQKAFIEPFLKDEVYVKHLMLQKSALKLSGALMSPESLKSLFTSKKVSLIICWFMISFKLTFTKKKSTEYDAGITSLEKLRMENQNANLNIS